MRPSVDDGDFQLYVGDVLDVLPKLPSQSVDCVVTSPPYWDLRNYGIEGQLGLEATPDEFVANLVAVFRELRRVLADHGTCWVNLGDTYTGGSIGGGDGKHSSLVGTHHAERTGTTHPPLRLTPGLKPKDLIGVPWKVAFALQADGWYLRSDIIWAKANPLPESVTDRPTKSHEYVFLLSKSRHYYFDQEAVREPAEWNRWGDQTNAKYEGSKGAAGWISNKTREELNANRSSYRPDTASSMDGSEHLRKSDAGLTVNPDGRNIRSVWSIPTASYPEAHFATMPEELARRCILAGCRRGGVVLDPFGGSGTTALVARNHERRSILIELNPEYSELAAKRLSQLSLLSS